jgi:hypothetical protein
VTLHDRLLASLDPVRGRRLLDQIEQGVRPTARRRRIAAVMRLPRREDLMQRTNGGNR